MTRSSFRTCDSRPGVARLPGALLGVSLLFASGHAHAQEKPRDPVAAQALFKTALELVERGDDAAGCPKFEAALALYPSASTMIHIAQCHERAGKIATAWKDYGQALALNRETQGEERRKALERICQKGVDTLAPRLPRLSVVVSRPPAGLVVTLDGAELPLAALGEALPADPGSHEVRLSAPGYQTEARTVVLEENRTASIDITLAPAPAVPPPAPTTAAPPPSPAVPTAAPPAASKPEEPVKGGVPTWAWVTGGAGIVLTAAGAVFLAEDLAAISALQSNCTTDASGTSCKAGYDYQADNDRKNRSLPLFIGLGSAGVLAIGAAIFGIATAPRAAAPPRASLRAYPWIGPGQGGVTLTGELF
jgi:hypothetical protein